MHVELALAIGLGCDSGAEDAVIPLTMIFILSLPFVYVLLWRDVRSFILIYLVFHFLFTIPILLHTH